MTTSQELVQQQRDLVAFADDPRLVAELSEVLPENVSVARFKRGLMNAVLENPQIVQCERASLYRAVLRAATDGLIPDGKQGAIVPYNDRKAGVTKATWIPMIGGIRDMLAQFGWSLRTAVVYSNDHFEDHSTEGYVVHRPPRPGVERGSVQGAYAMAVHRDGRREAEVYSEAQIQEVRAKASKTDKVWNEWPDRMREKTPAHRLAKKLPLDPADKERLERVLAASETDPVGLLYGDAEQPHSVAEPPDPVVPQLPPEPGDQAAGEVPSSPASGPPDGVDAETGEIVGEAFEGEEPPPLTDEPPPAQEEGEEPRFETGRYAGQAIGEVWAAGPDGQAYVRWAYKAWKSEPMRSALDRFGDEQKQART